MKLTANEIKKIKNDTQALIENIGIKILSDISDLSASRSVVDACALTTMTCGQNYLNLFLSDCEQIEVMLRREEELNKKISDNSHSAKE